MEEQVMNQDVQTSSVESHGSDVSEFATDTVNAQTEDMGSVETGVIESQVIDNAGTTDDVTKSESFSKRLKEMTAKERAALEEEYKPKAQVYNQLEGIAKELGFNGVDDYLTAVEEQKQRVIAQREADRMNIDIETYNQYFNPVNEKLSKYEQELKVYRQREIEREVKAELETLKDKPFFEDYKEDIFKLAMDSGVKLKDAYKLVTYDAIADKAKRDAEQEVIANISKRDSKQVLSSNDRGSTSGYDPSKLTPQKIAEISARVQRGEKITPDQF